MKTKAMLIAVVLLCTSLSWGSVGFGVKAGGVFNILRITDNPGYNFLKDSLSWQFGLQGSLGLGQNLRFCPELMLSRYRSSLDDEQEGLPVEWSFTQTELQVPLLLKWQFLARVKGWEPYLLLGPMLQYTLSNRFSLTMDGQRDDFDMGDLMTRFHYSLVLGTGVALPLASGRTKVSAEIRYCQGMKNQIADLNEGKYFKGSAVFLLGYLF